MTLLQQKRYAELREDLPECLCCRILPGWLPLGMQMERKILLDLISAEMPFGKYKGRKLIDLPEFYLVWFSKEGFPKGKLGEQLALVHEIKLNGLEYLFAPLRKGRK